MSRNFCRSPTVKHSGLMRLPTLTFQINAEHKELKKKNVVI